MASESSSQLTEQQTAAVDALKLLAGAQDDGVRAAKRLLDGLRLPEIKALCRELNVKMGKANKAALVERLLSYGEMGLLAKGLLDEEETIQKVSYLPEDVSAVLARLPSFDSDVLSALWSKDFPRMSMSYGRVYNYLVELRSKTDDDRQKNSFKSMKGYSYFSSGWVAVENVWMCEPPLAPLADTDTPQPGCDEQAREASIKLLFCKGFVNKSYMSKERHAYSVYVCLDGRGRIYNARCPCVAGRGESCSHVAALLFYILDCHEKALDRLPESTTRTGRPMTWNVPPPLKDVEAAPVEDMVFAKAQYGKDSRCVSGGSLEHYDPRQPDDRTLDEDKLQVLLEAMKVSFPESGLLHFWDVDVGSGKDGEKEEDVARARKLVIPRHGRQELDMPDLTEGAAEVFCEDYLAELKISEEMSLLVEKLTVDQRKSSLWCDLHVGRITSSTFHDVLVRRCSTPPDALVKR